MAVAQRHLIYISTEDIAHKTSMQIAAKEPTVAMMTMSYKLRASLASHIIILFTLGLDNETSKLQHLRTKYYKL